MKLSYIRPYLSIQSFPEIDIPPFTLITGVNGSGKTHLLQALAKGNVQIDIAANPQDDARFFDWNNLVPNNTGEFQTIGLYSERDQVLEWARVARRDQHEALVKWKSEYAARNQSLDDASLLRLSKEQLTNHIDDFGRVDEAWHALEQIGNGVVNRLMKNARGKDPIAAKLSEFKDRLGHRVAALRLRDFEDKPFGWGQADVFQQSFAQLFLAYFEIKRLNMLRRLDESEDRQPSVPSLPDDQFFKQYGEPPWDFVNRTLADAGLDFAIDYPVEHSTTKFTPQLRKTTSGIELQFSELSSGEKILMSFAFCLYYSLDTRQVLRRPKVLLFDEIDAPLHPSMSRQLVETIQQALVKEQGVQVILASHSPSTVAVTPEDCVYAMYVDKPGLYKVGKRQAIALLTSEIPTLSIDFAGRRQVFVESRYDAERYELLYRYLSQLIASERSLAFISVGSQKNGGDDNSGCDRVRQIVEDLVANGNDSVFGLIDWDTRNTGSDSVVVLAEGKQYAIENCLLDPLLVGALVVHTDRRWAEEQGIFAGKGYADLRRLEAKECQAIIDGVERLVLEISADSPFGERDEIEYTGGMKLNASKAYLQMQGHDLEELVKEKLPPLRRYHKQGELLRKIIDPVIFDLRHFAPNAILDAFETLLRLDHA